MSWYETLTLTLTLGLDCHSDRVWVPGAQFSVSLSPSVTPGWAELKIRHEGGWIGVPRRGWLRVYHSLRRSTFRRRAFAIAMMTLCLACAHCERNKAVKSNTVKVRALRNKMYECSPPPYLSCVGTRTSFQSPQKCTEYYVVHGVAAPVLRRSERFKSITLHAVLHVGDGKCLA